MDFNCLSRKQLQTLCKQNKIPANITNVAMVNALSALHKVEGLEEFINCVESDNQKSPEKLMPECPDVPKTACRTTSRKQVAVESLSVVNTRRSMRRYVGVEAEQENKNVNQLVTPAAPVTRTRRMATAAGSTRQRSVAVEQKSVQRGDGTRQSMRLLEKCLREMIVKEEGKMSVKEEGKIEPVKFDVSESNEVSDEIVDKIGGLEDFLPQNQSVKRENDENDKLPKDNSNTEYEMEKCSVKLSFDGDDNLGNPSGFDAKDEVDDENSNKHDEFDPCNGENNETPSAAMIPEMSNEVSNNGVLLVVEMADDTTASAMEAKKAETAASPDEELSAPNEIKESLKLKGHVGDDSAINPIENDQHGNLEEGFDCKQLEEQVEGNETRESVKEQVSYPSETIHCEKLATETKPEDHKLDNEREECHHVSNDVVMEIENNEVLSECDAITHEELSECSIEAAELKETQVSVRSTKANLEEKIVLENAVSVTSDNLEKIQEEEIIVPSNYDTLNEVSNINITGEKVEAKQEEVNIMLGAMSIRQLTKMIKELQITKKKKEEKKNANKAAKERLPLQRLPDNRMAITESGEEL